MNKLFWYVKQLLPLTYVSEYIENGKKKLTVWKMWFGKCFSIKTWSVV